MEEEIIQGLRGLFLRRQFALELRYGAAVKSDGQDKNTVYEEIENTNNPYSSSDRWLRLGRVVSEIDPSAESMYIWSVKGSDEYIYRVWGMYDGGFYRKVR